MTQIRRHNPNNATDRKEEAATRIKICVGVIVFFIFFFSLFPSSSHHGTSTATVSTPGGTGDNNNANNPTTAVGKKSLRQSISSVYERRRKQLTNALRSLTEGNIPQRLRDLRDKHMIVGERINEVRAGKETVMEILHGNDLSGHDENIDLSPMALDDIINYLDNWIHQLHAVLQQAKHATFEGIWQAYHDLTVETLYPWDREYLRRMPPRRNDGSIFLSVATYRDENCFNTVYQAYNKAANPKDLYIGLVQQNCHTNCRSGVLSNLSMVPVPPDEDCSAQFCATDLGKPICARDQIRVLNIDEPESLGPYAARYFASKLWYGEQWFMQIDAHMTFATGWDQTSVNMLQSAPSKKPVLSHYPPGHNIDLDNRKDKPTSRLCGPVFATSDLESQIIRLEGASQYDHEKLDVPGFAPFTAAGYFVAHSEFLREVPFDPFLPWIFMGEEIIMSSRLWTAGYDIFSPNEAVVGHMYVRRHKPKFWESVHRAFSMGVHNPLQMMVLDRVKYQLGYPESARDMLKHKSILTAVEQYSMGTTRPLQDYMNIVGMNMTTKTMTKTKWCEGGFPPPGFEQYNHLYPAGRAREQEQHHHG